MNFLCCLLMHGNLLLLRVDKSCVEVIMDVTSHRLVKRLGDDEKMIAGGGGGV